MAQLVEGLEQLLDDGWCQAFEGLIEQQHACVARQRPGHRDHLLLAAGQVVRRRAPALFDAREEAEDFLLFPVDAGVVAPFQAPQLHVLGHRHAGKQAAALRNIGHAAARDLGRWAARQGFGPERDLAAGRWADADDGLEKCRLARAVAPEQRDDLVVAQLEADIAQDVALAVEGVHAFDPEQGGVARCARSLDGRQRMRARTDVDRLHLRRVARIVDAAVNQHLTVVHHRDTVGQRKHPVDVVFDQQHRQVGRNALDQAANAFALGRCQPRQRFV